MESDDVFRALADPTRRKILLLLATDARSVGELAAEFEVTRPAISHHLKVLGSAGLVEQQPDGNRRRYSLVVDGVDGVIDFCIGLRSQRPPT